MTPEIIDRYLRLATGSDTAALAECFTPDAVVTDDGRTYHGRDEIRAWRDSVASAFEYTARVLQTEAGADGRHVVTALVEGSFPGSPLQLRYAFTLRDNRISELIIAP
jgi:hypothetical protein